jgi:hypothetical protein
MPEALAILRTVAAVVRASLRVSFHQRGRSLPELVSTLRSTPRSSPRDPRLTLAVLEKMLAFVPPYGAGRCVKRSLLLLDLWSRAGLEPSLHLGLRAGTRGRGGHAWITTREDRLGTYRPPDVVEAFALDGRSAFW